jgi:tetratricopeptide (TPR) repeat protein
VTLKLTITTLFLFLLVSANAQTELEKIKQLEEQRQIDKQRRSTVKLDSAIRLSEEGHYEEADEKFKTVLKTIRSVPSDLTFHFGRNSFYIGKYKQSVDWLNKYIQLKGTSGQYSEQAVEWLAKAEVELLKEKEREAKQASEVLSKDYTIDCGPAGKVVCTVCKGSTVLVKKGYFGDNYSTCGYCHKLGYLTCVEYNQLLKGTLKPDVSN